MKDKEVAHAQAFDPGRGAFDPVLKEPVVDRETNPRGVRHIAKTEQDDLPKDKRQRYKDAERRRARSKKEAG